MSQNKDFPAKETARLILREIKPNDAEALFDYFSRDEVTQYYDLPSFSSIEQAKTLIANWQNRYKEGEAIRWGIALIENPSKLIGTCGFHNISKSNSRAEIGYELHPEQWGNGYASEAIKVLIKYGFGIMKLHRIEAFTDPANAASEAVLLKNGMMVEGILRDYFFEKGRFVDAKLFSILGKDRT